MLLENKDEMIIFFRKLSNNYETAGKKMALFFFLENRKKLFLFRKKKMFALVFEITIMFRLREEYKYHIEMQTLQLQSRLVPFLIIMISAGVSGSAPNHSSQLPSHKYITALLASITTSLTFISTKNFFN